MRICLMGNSHMAAWKAGYDEMVDAGEWPTSVSVTFFASPSDGLLDIGVSTEQRALEAPEGSELRMQLERTSGGVSAIRPDDYDFNILVGMVRVPDLEKRFSSDLISEIFSGTKHYCGAAKIMPRIRSVTDLPIYVMPQPLTTNPRSAYPANYEPISYAERLQGVANALTHHNVIVMGQPVETLLEPQRTKPEMSSSAPRLDLGQWDRVGSKHPSTDYFHMNGAFGRLSWLSFLQSVGVEVPAARPHRQTEAALSAG